MPLKTYTDAQVETKIRRAYKKLSGGRPTTISISAIRYQLNHVSPDHITRVLAAMNTDPTVHLRAEADQKRLQLLDILGAITLDGTRRHTLLITDRKNPRMPATSHHLVEALIRDTYHRLTGGRHSEIINLEALRAELLDEPGITRELIDTVLYEIADAPDIYLSPEADQKRLTPADWAHALNLGGIPRHTLRICPPLDLDALFPQD